MQTHVQTHVIGNTLYVDMTVTEPYGPGSRVGVAVVQPTITREVVRDIAAQFLEVEAPLVAEVVVPTDHEREMGWYTFKIVVREGTKLDEEVIAMLVDDFDLIKSQVHPA